MAVFVIAEAAACHDGDFVKGCRLIALAKQIGADAVKFQFLSSAERLCERRRAPEYLNAYKLLELPPDWLQALKNQCDLLGIEFMTTCYLSEDIPVIAPYVKRFKVASFEAGDEDFIAAHFKYDNGTPIKPIIVSLGMGKEGFSERFYDEHYNGLHLLEFLHCVSAYPAPVEEMNLKRLWSDRFPVDGLSDHSRHPWTGALAVAAGAEIIEFHIRLADTDPQNADYAVARDPEEAAAYVRNIRFAEAAMGDGQRRVMPSEEKMLRFRVKP